MRKICLFFLLVVFLFNVSFADVIISEVADPNDDYHGRFVELYNTGTGSVNLNGWELRRYANGSSSSSDIDLSGYSIPSCSAFIIANNSSNFQSLYGFPPDMDSGYISGNGNDVYELYNGASVEDIFGEVGVDAKSEGSDWYYEDGRGLRHSDIDTGNTTWTSSEWDVWSDDSTNQDTTDMDPGTHDNDTCSGPGDITSPTLTGIIPQATSEIKITFSEEVTEASAEDTANYEISAQPDYNTTDTILLLTFDSDTAEAPSGDYTEADDEITTFSGRSELMVDNSTLVTNAQYVEPSFDDADTGAYQGGGKMICDSNDATNMAGVVAHDLPTYTGDFTIEAIIKFEDNTFPGRTVTLADIIGRDSGAGSTCANWVIRAIGPGFATRPNSVEFMYDAGTEAVANSGNNTIPANDTWFHVAGVLDYNESNPPDSHIELWIDGVRVAGPVGCNAAGKASMGGTAARDKWLGIGCAYTTWFTGGGGDPRSFEGAIDAAALTLDKLDAGTFVLPSQQSTFTATRTTTGTVVLDVNGLTGDAKDVTVWAEGIEDPSGNGLEPIQFRAIPGICAPGDVDGINERGDTAYETVRVTVEGAITDNVLDGGKAAYIGGSDGLLIYDGNSSFVTDESLDVGDQIRITATVDNYRGKAEMVNGLGGFVITPLGTTSLTPEVVSIDCLGPEPFAGEAKDGNLITINNVHFQDSDWGPWSSGDYSIDVAGKTGTLYVDSDTDLVGGGPVPSIANVTGILGQYDNSVPYDSGYQIYPRSLADIDTLVVPVELSVFEIE